MTTARDIIQEVLKSAGVLGVGQTALAEDTNSALYMLNMMIAQWQRKRWLIYTLVDTSLLCTGAQSYTVGVSIPASNFPIVRPPRIEDAYVVQQVSAPANAISYPLQIITAREDYDRIALKQLASFPSYLFYDAAFPVGRVYPWPIPSNQYTLHIVTRTVLANFPTLDTDFLMPPEYQEAIHWNLAARLRPNYQLDPDPTVVALAKNSLDTIRNANLQIARLRLPRGLRRPGIYNIYSDQVY